jgi:sigma54-dependent transcription regulator
LPGKLDRARLKRTYVEARYSAGYEISGTELEALEVFVAQLREIVIAICTEHLDELKRAAELPSAPIFGQSLGHPSRIRQRLTRL